MTLPGRSRSPADIGSPARNSGSFMNPGRPGYATDPAPGLKSLQLPAAAC
jgi:hypothetical protein